MNFALDNLYDWVILLVVTAALLWFAERIGEWVRAHSLVNERTRPYSTFLALVTGVVLEAGTFRLPISSLLVSILCSLVFTALRYFLERTFGSLENS